MILRIIEIKIENFGKLSCYQRTLTSGINAINEENGWGKSTLAAFIKVMFFGFDGDSKRDKNARERDRFRPWQSGTYGGSIIFEAKGREYRMIRIFGNKAGEDTFSLYDNKTNLPSSDYSDRIGEELFSLDADSFCKTVFINQNHVETCATDSINAKLGNLTGATDDIDNYDAVANKFKDKLNALSLTRKTGLLFGLKNEITSLSSDIRAIPGVQAGIEAKNNSLNDLNNKMKEYKTESDSLGRELSEASKAAELISKKEQYDGICSRYKDREEKLKAAASVFTTVIPDKTDLEMYSAGAAAIGKMKLEAAGYKLSADEETIYRNQHEYFTSGIDIDAISSAEAAAADIAAREQAYNALQFSEEEKADFVKYSVKFEGKEGVDETASALINNLSVSNSKKNALPSQEALLQTLSMQKARKEPNVLIILLIIGIIIACAGTAILFALSGIAGIISMCAGAACIIASLVVKFIAKSGEKENKEESQFDALKKAIESDKAFVDSTESSVRQFLADYSTDFDPVSSLGDLSEIKNEYKRYKSLAAKRDDQRDDILLAEIRSGREKLDGFLLPYSDLCSGESDYSSKLQTLRHTALAFARISEKRNEYLKRTEEIKARESTVLDYITSLGFTAAEGEEAGRLSEIKGQLAAYKDQLNELDLISNEKNKFESTCNISEIMSFVSDPGRRSADEIRKQISDNSDARDSLAGTVSELLSGLSEEQERLDSLHEKEEILNEKQEQFDNLKKREALISRTKDLLEKAKTSFVGKYTEGVAKGFKKYYGLVEGTEGKEFSFNANMSFLIEDHGDLRELSSYSAGSRDKMSICFRMGLIEAMFTGEKPFVIMDDPFVNLDSKRLAGGLSMLDALKDDYQIIYLTCHESRMP